MNKYLNKFIQNNKKRCYELNKKYCPPSFKTPVDIWEDFIQRNTIKSSGILLSAGCGKGRENFEFHEICNRCIGIDLDMHSLSQNSKFDYLINGNLESLPFKDSSFDMIITRDVLEHLENPIIVFREFSRVLKTNASLILLTPNIYNYVTIIGKLTPFRFHRYFRKLLGINEDDTFPTFYRANSLRKLDMLAKNAGLKREQTIMVQKWPSYLIFSVALFKLGILYERLLKRFSFLKFMRSAIVAEYKKIA